MIPHAHTHAIAACAAVWGWCTAPSLLTGSAGYDMAMCPNHIILNNVRRRAAPPDAAQKQHPVIRNSWPHKGKLFRECSALVGKALSDGVNADIRSGHGYPLPDLRPARCKLSKGVPHETLCRLGVAGTPRPAAAGR